MLSIKTIDAVRELPISEVLSRHIDLKKSGINFKALCPFHNENTPSFVVSNHKNLWTCFGGCGSGDGIAFAMRHEKMDFIEACKAIALQHGIPIEETETKGKTDEQKREEDLMQKTVTIVAEQYRAALQRQKLQALPWTLKKQWARVYKYLKQDRKLTTASLIEWQLGLCADWKVAAPDLIAAGSYKPAEDCGLLRTGNGNTYDFFHHRITIPIRNQNGQVIGLGGRIIPGVDGAKYLNSPESPVYPKSKVLFGLDKARKHFRSMGGAVLVEGYFDVIKLHQCGWINTVASCGTALTETQAKLLKRYTDTVYIMRDGDSAGRRATEKDIAVLVAHQFKVYLYQIPDGNDPDSLFDNHYEYTRIMPSVDAIEWLCMGWLKSGKASGSASQMSEGIEKTVQLLGDINNQVLREQYMKNFCSHFKLKVSELSKPLDQFFQKRKEDSEAKSDNQQEGKIPQWADRNQIEENGFVQLEHPTKNFKPGIYFASQDGLYRITNFVIKPLYHIYEQTNNRRLIEINNGVRSSVVEMPSQGLIQKNVFEMELINKGNFVCDVKFMQKEFKRLTGWLSAAMPIAYELKTLGWQPEGFFAYSNAVFVAGESYQLLEYDEMGMIEINDKRYISLGNSKVHRDERTTDNAYENDLFLKHVKTNISFSTWADTFYQCYANNAPYGIAFTFMTIFKDIITRFAKMPMLYPYGPKGSGKSSFAESITWLFFSGKNGEGDLIKGFNLNKGQSTPFSFFNRMERFRNCPILLNEFDENEIDPQYFGALKAAYDGEGREVGDGTSGKSRKTRIQKINGTLIPVGQYLSIKDDGSVLSRSISCQFGIERMRNITEDERKVWEKLHSWELEGLSGVLIELLQQRPQVTKLLPKHFTETMTRLAKETRAEGHRIETRLISNYSLVLAATSVMDVVGIRLPYSFEDFYKRCKAQAIEHNRLLKDNSAIHQFWKTIEFLFDTGVLQDGRDIKIEKRTSVTLKDGSNIVKKELDTYKNLIFVRFSNVYALYSKVHRERSGKTALPEETLLLYVRELPYFIGLCPYMYFSDKKTSAYVMDYDQMKEFGIVLEKNNHNDPVPQQPAIPQLLIDEEPDFIKNQYNFNNKD
jgi:DNA primase